MNDETTKPNITPILIRIKSSRPPILGSIRDIYLKAFNEEAARCGAPAAVPLYLRDALESHLKELFEMSDEYAGWMTGQRAMEVLAGDQEKLKQCRAYAFNAVKEHFTKEAPAPAQGERCGDGMHRCGDDVTS